MDVRWVRREYFQIGMTMHLESRPDLPTLFEKARALPPDERSAFIDEACKDDSRLRAELVSLLDHGDRAADRFAALRSGVLPYLRSLSSEVSETDRGPDPEIGRSIAHYRILEKLGGGGMGDVYKARDRKLDRMVALKFLPSSLSSNEAAKSRFLLEARAASALDHANICSIYDIAEDGSDRIFISMAYCDGETIQEKIARSPIDVAEALDYARQTALGLAHAHAHGIVHRDIKPANLIVIGDGTVKIVDFGIARVPDVSLTSTGAVVGTAAYMSPEQIRGETIDLRVDLWALGVVLYEMLTGERPFPGEYEHAIMYAVLNEEPTPISARLPDAPLQLTHLVNRLLAKSAAKRYQHASDVVQDLDALQKRYAAIVSTGRDGWVAHPLREDDPVMSTTLRLHDPRANAPLPVKILVVDDEPDVELLMRQKFLKRVQANEWSFAFATNGNEALNILESDPDVAIVLTDIRMPGMDGLALLRRIDEMDRPMKTIVISAYGDMENIRMAMNLGAFDFLTKPINLGDLEKTIIKTWNEFLADVQAIEAKSQLMAITQEIEVARRIQEAMLPSPFPRHDRVDAYAFTARARDVGGDFYDFFPIDDGWLGFFIGDVASRGVSAALFSTITHMFLKGSALQGRSPGACLALLNRLLYPEGFPELSVSIFFGRLELATGELAYCNAGHPAPLLLDDTGEVSALTNGVQDAVWTGRTTEYETVRVPLLPGQELLLYTDGVTEARNVLDHTFSTERLSGILTKCHGLSSAELIREIVRDVMSYSEDMPLSDDITVMALRHLNLPAAEIKAA